MLMWILQRRIISFECWMSERIDEMTMTMTVMTTTMNHRMDVHAHDSTWMSLLMLTISHYESDSDLVAMKNHDDDHDDYGTKKLM